LEKDPLSPPEEEVAQGEHPLDPLFFSGYISTFSGVIAIGGMPERRGRKHEKPEPQERLFVSLRISTEPLITKNLMVTIRKWHDNKILKKSQL
jgi:hypothetical protein